MTNDNSIGREVDIALKNFLSSVSVVRSTRSVDRQ